jgi:energy-coupling factor transport system permease protein
VSHFARVNPVAKLAAAFILSVTLLLSIDFVSALVALTFEAALFPLTGIGWRRFLRRTLPLFVAAPLAGLTTVLYGIDSGEVLWEFGWITVTEGSLELGGVITLRLLAAVLPAIVLFANTDPTNLADGLAQNLRLPARFVLGGLAALRLVGLMVEDWRMLELARRARGVGDRARIRRLFGQAFTLLVLAIRRGSALATAMEARGFGSTRSRTWAREARFGSAEWLLIGVATAVATAAVLAAVAAGTWRWLLG